MIMLFSISYSFSSLITHNTEPFEHCLALVCHFERIISSELFFPTEQKKIGQKSIGYSTPASPLSTSLGIKTKASLGVRTSLPNQVLGIHTATHPEEKVPLNHHLFFFNDHSDSDCNYYL